MTMMTVYESMAHALANEQGRALFLNRHHSENTYGFRTRFWRWLLISYGEQLYELPRRMGLPPIEGTARRLPYNFPAYDVASSMMCGIAPSEALKYPTMVGFSHQHTPIHLGSALKLLGRDEDAEEAATLLSVPFQRSVFPSRTAPDFVSNTYINPVPPEELGKKPYDMELLLRPDGDLYILDELGNAAWFPPEYVERILSRVERAHWYSRLCQLNAIHGRWTPYIESVSRELIRDRKDGFRAEYRNTTNYLRNVKRAVAEVEYKKFTGVRQILMIVRHDATTSEMTKGLRTLANNHNDRTKELFRFIGRPLTVEDFRGLSAQHVLEILYHAPMEAVQSVIATSSEELGSMMFSLTDGSRMGTVVNSMSDHRFRAKPWLPDTPEGNLSMILSSTTTPQDMRKTWIDYMKKRVDAYGQAKPWRDEFIELAQPEVLLLALSLWAFPNENDPLPTVAIENVLRSHPNIVPIQRMIKRIPEHIGKLTSV